MIERVFRSWTQSARPLHEAVEHHFPSCLVEVDGELVAVDGGDGAGAELLVEDALARGEAGLGAGRFGDQLALDQQRAALRAASASAGEAAAVAAVVGKTALAELVPTLRGSIGLRALPAGGGVGRGGEGLH